MFDVYIKNGNAIFMRRNSLDVSEKLRIFKKGEKLKLADSIKNRLEVSVTYA